jgi:hypothetical protein
LTDRLREEVFAMRGSLRVHSLRDLALLVGWSLLSHARERVTWARTPRTTKNMKTIAARALTTESRAPLVDTRVWN